MRVTRTRCAGGKCDAACVIIHRKLQHYTLQRGLSADSSLFCNEGKGWTRLREAHEYCCSRKSASDKTAATAHCCAAVSRFHLIDAETGGMLRARVPSPARPQNSPLTWKTHNILSPVLLIPRWHLHRAILSSGRIIACLPIDATYAFPCSRRGACLGTREGL